jgi:hypothetical protein
LIATTLATQPPRQALSDLRHPDAGLEREAVGDHWGLGDEKLSIDVMP